MKNFTHGIVMPNSRNQEKYEPTQEVFVLIPQASSKVSDKFVQMCSFCCLVTQSIDVDEG